SPVRSAMPLSIHVESPRRVPVRKALKTDRVLKFGRDTIRVHSLILDQSKPLRDLVRGQGARMTYNLDALKREHGFLSAAGLRHAIDFMYGQAQDVSLHELYDLFAAAHALDLDDLLEVLRAELIKMSRDPTTALFALEHAYNHLSPPAEEAARNAALHLPAVCKQRWCAELTPVAFEALIKESSYLCPIALDVDVYVCTILDWLAANRKEITLARKLLSLIELRDASPAQSTRIRDRLFSLKLIEQVGGVLSYALSNLLPSDDSHLSSIKDQRSSLTSSPSSSLLDRAFAVPSWTSAASSSLSERTMVVTPRVQRSWRATADETSIRTCTPRAATKSGLAEEERVLCYDFGEIPVPPPDAEGGMRVVTVSMDLDNDEDVFEHLRSLRICFDFDTRPT
ncbi:hypothetical protein PENTCL1PPCAC_18499, partial [Pristionchus entomophagus]